MTETAQIVSFVVANQLIAGNTAFSHRLHHYILLFTGISVHPLAIRTQHIVFSLDKLPIQHQGITGHTDTTVHKDFSKVYGFVQRTGKRIIE